MKKYYIEGGLNFYEELYKSLDDEDNQNNIVENKLCLITDEPLTDKYIQMECGHKFNYIPLYYDIKNHKQKFNSLESNATRLHTNEIRCPYCRNKQIGVLPYYPELGLDKVNGVNYTHPSYKQPLTSSKYKYKKCEFVYDVSNNNIITTCSLLGSQINYNNGILDDNNYGDEKYYCWNHKKMMIKKYKKDIANKLLEEVKKAKLEAKMKAKEEKLEAKMKAKEEKLEAKMKAKEEKLEAKMKTKTKEETNINQQNLICENVVLGINANNENINYGCNNVLKTGPKKGTFCGCKIFSENLCKRHYNLKHHVIVK
jgi:hypothetical protein